MKELEKKVKERFCQQLLNNGYDTAEITQAPADITATKNGETWWFEIKYTTKKGRYYGGSTETEWEKAFEDPEHYKFVVIRTTPQMKIFDPKLFTPMEFMEFCTIPPFTVNFNIPIPSSKKEGKKSFIFNKEIFNKLHELYEEIRKSESDKLC